MFTVNQINRTKPFSNQAWGKPLVAGDFPTPKKFMTIQEVAVELGVTDRHVRELIVFGCLEAYDISKTGRVPHAPKSIRVSVSSLERFKEERRIEGE